MIVAATIALARQLNILAPSGQSAAKIAISGIDSLIAEKNHPAIISYLNRFTDLELGRVEQEEDYDEYASKTESLNPDSDNDHMLLNMITQQAEYKEEDEAESIFNNNDDDNDDDNNDNDDDIQNLGEDEEDEEDDL